MQRGVLQPGQNARRDDRGGYLLRHGARFRILHLPWEHVYVLGTRAARGMGVARGCARAHLDWRWNVDGRVVQTLDSKADVQSRSDSQSCRFFWLSWLIWTIACVAASMTSIILFVV